MSRFSLLFPLLLLGLVLAPKLGADSDKVPALPLTKTFQIPYKLTSVQHIVVRAKINGKGPFNFVLDTGAPALFIATKVAKQAGLNANEGKWGTADRFEIEGGLVIPKARARIETPFQLEGMNGMGMAGMEIHGLMGYSLVAKYRMEIDLTRTKMIWTELAHQPGVPGGMGGKGGGQGGLDALGGVYKFLGGVLGRKATPDVTLRGFYGMTLIEGGDNPRVESVLPKGPAGEAGLLPGDVITRIQGRGVNTLRDALQRMARQPTAGEVKLTVVRGKENREITIKTTGGI